MYSLTFLQNLFYSLLHDSEHMTCLEISSSSLVAHLRSYPPFIGFLIPLLGFFFIRPVPPPEEELNRQVYSEISSSSYEQRNSLSSHTPLLNYNPHPVCVTYRLSDVKGFPRNDKSYLLHLPRVVTKNHCHGLDVLIKQESPINPIG